MIKTWPQFFIMIWSLDLIMLIGLYCKKKLRMLHFCQWGIFAKAIDWELLLYRSSPETAQPSAARHRRRGGDAGARAGLATAVGAAIVLPFRLVPSFLPTPIQLLTWFLDSKSFEHRLLRLRHWMAADGGERRRCRTSEEGVAAAVWRRRLLVGRLEGS